MNNNIKPKLDIIPTLCWVAGGLSNEEVISDILEQHTDCGLNKFLLIYPNSGLVTTGMPPVEEYRRGGKVFRQIKEAVAPHGISLGWWLTTSVNSGPVPEFQRLVKPDGTLPPYSNCPLCSNFRKRLSESVAAFAEEGTPDFIFFEDDFSICAQTNNMGCFCDEHLAEFSRREGKTYTRETLVPILRDKTPEALEINRHWRELIKDSLVGLATAIRTELDKKNPEISIGHMQAGSSDWEGDSTEAIARAFAGPNHTPYTRYFSCLYGRDCANELPDALFNPLYKIQHTGKNYRFYHESDSWPHKRFFRSSAYMRACMGAVYSMGYDGSTYNNVQYLDNQNEDKAYNMMIDAEFKRFNEAHNIAKKCNIKGACLEYDPFYSTVYGDGKSPAWLDYLAQFGIPVTTDSADVKFWDKTQAQYMDDDAVMKALSKGLFLDGEAAKCLCERGYGKYLGVSVTEPICKNSFFNTFSPDADPLSYDFGAREIICKDFRDDGKGFVMDAGYGYSPNGVGDIMRINVTEPECEVISELYNYKRECISPVMTRFKNSLGGKVVVMANTLGCEYTIINYRRQRLIQKLILWCNDEIVFIREAPSVFVIMNEALDSLNCGFKGMVTLVNLCEDSLSDVKLHLPEKWCDLNEVCILNRDGEWCLIPFELCDQTLVLKERLRYLEPMYILIK